MRRVAAVGGMGLSCMAVGGVRSTRGDKKVGNAPTALIIGKYARERERGHDDGPSTAFTT
jgi:hypothetical protein